MSITAIEVPDRIKLPMKFDPILMLKEIKALELKNFLYYDVLPLRSPAHLVDTSLPFPPPATDYADGSWTEWMDTPELKKSPYLTSVVDTFRAHTSVTLVRILRLGAGEVVKEHKDPTLGIEVEKSVVRMTVPIQVGDGVNFYLNSEPVPMKVGECWYMRLTDPHKVVNDSSIDRINMTIDMVPNDWVRSLLYG